MPLDFGALAAVDPQRLPELRLGLHPSARLAASPFPILRIWQTNQPGYEGDDCVDLGKGGDTLLVLRALQGIVVERIGAAVHAFLAALAANESLAQAAAYWSAYADTKKRPVPLSLASYMLGWTVTQYHALLYRERFPDRMHVVRAEDVMADPRGTLGALCMQLGLEPAESLATPSWNGVALDEIYPWGTIRKPTPENNRATAESLSERERAEARARAWQYLEVFDYKNFL